MSDAPHKYFYQTMDANGAPCMMPHPEGEWVERVRYDRAEARIAELEAEVREMYEEVLIEMSTVKDGGWYVTNARSGAVYAGDQLVKMGQWERDDTRGYGRVQWYRPLTRSKEARDE